MKTKWNAKAMLAKTLAAIMVFSVILPGGEAYAASGDAGINPGDPVSIIFDPGIGPDLSYTTFSPALDSSYQRGPLTINGKAGDYLNDNENLKKIDVTYWHDTSDGKSLDFPMFTKSLEKKWNYKFAGWVESEGGQILMPADRLDPRFQYKNQFLYTAKWESDPTKKYDYSAVYFRDHNSLRNDLDPANPNAWPSDTDPDIWKIKPNEWKNNVPVSIGTPMTIPATTMIPGYELKDVLIRNNVSRKYDGTPIPDPDKHQGVYVNTGGANINVGGYMPNDDLSVAFRYEPITSRKLFTVTADCVDLRGNNLHIETYGPFSAEETAHITPPDVPGYTVQSGSVTDGGVDSTSAGLFAMAAADRTPVTGTNNFEIHMPNQPVKISYVYKPDVEPESDVTISYWEQEKGEDKPLTPPAGAPVHIQLQKDQTLNIPIPEIGGYQFNTFQTSEGFHCILNGERNQITVSFNALKNTLKLYYFRNTDPNYWGTVNFVNDTAKGTLIDAPSEIQFRKTEGLTVDQLTGGIGIVPKPHYIPDGWYQADQSQTRPVGERLDGSKVIRSTMTLYANFIEKSDEWYDITFQSGANGKIAPSGKLHTNSTLTPTWQELNKPAATPDTGYLFDCWVDEAGNRILSDSDMPIMSSQKYTAVFTPIGISPDGILARPDASGAVAGDAGGQITVYGANTRRKYALTDSQGTILEAENGAWLAGNRKFKEKLKPCTGYRVYELASDTVPQTGNTLPGAGISENQISNPALVSIPALGSNYKVEEDGNGKMKLVISPAAATAQYAILDGNGRQVTNLGTDGWVTPVSGQAILGGLSGNQLYTVVARQTDEAVKAEDKAPMGTQISIAGNPQAETEYTIQIQNGGYISEYNGTPMSQSQVTQLTARKGDKVTIAAPGFVEGTGRRFNQWDTVIGPRVRKDAQSQTIEIQANMVLSARYEEAQTATWSNAAIAYSSNSGSVGLDMSESRQDALKEVLTANPTDANALSHGSKVTYTFKINKRTPRASESNAVKAQISSGESRIPWAITADITRSVGSMNQEIPEGVNQNAEIKLFSDMDKSVQGYSDYGLWELAPDGSVTQVAMTPDPNSGTGFTGLLSFYAKAGYTYLASYVQAYTVTVTDNKKPGNSMEILVLPDSGLSEAPGYAGLDTGPITGYDGEMTWEYAGLTAKDGSQSQLIDPDMPVTKNMKLWALYDDTKWKAAGMQLSGQLDIAKALIENPSVAAADKERLQAVFTPALEAVNDHRVSVNRLNSLYNDLKAVVDNVVIGGDPDPAPPDPTPPDPTPPDPKPPVPDHPGGGGSGGSGGSGGGGGGRGSGFKSLNNAYTFNRYKTYFSGVEGTWLKDGASGLRAFVLSDGTRVQDQWANITYDDARDTHTYHFNKEGLTDSGWYKDGDGNWFFLKDTGSDDYGSLVTGWHYDGNAGKWYYLNQFNGSMATGWQQVGNDYYYLNPVSAADRPLGSMYANEVTPDGYPVDQSGRWLRETP